MQYILPKSRHEETQDTPDNTDAESLSVDDKQFCELFSFPLSESPLPGKAVLGTVLPPSVKKSTPDFFSLSEHPLPSKTVPKTFLSPCIRRSTAS